MSNTPQKQPERKTGNGWAIGFAALFVGYVLGENSAPSAEQPSSASRPPILTTSATTDAAAVDMTATAMNAPDATATVENAAEYDAAATTDNTSTDDSADTTYQPASYAPSSTYPSAQGTAGSADDAPTTVQTAGTAIDADDPTFDEAAAVARAAVASTKPWTRSQPTAPTSTYSAPPYSYTPPAVGYSSSIKKCEGLGCYGVISNVTGLPRTTYVRGYTRKDGTYVQPHYRSRRR